MPENTSNHPTPFGILLDDERREARKSIRQLAREVGVSHVMIGNVIRGQSLILGRDYWPNLTRALPALTTERLEHAAQQSQGRQLRPWEYEEPARRELAARFAQEVDELQSQQLSEERTEILLEFFRRIQNGESGE